MAKEYLVRLSPPGTASGDGTVEDVRKIELSILSQLNELAASKEKEHRKRNCIFDVIEQIDNVSDSDAGVMLTKDDLSRMDNGMKLVTESQAGMPILWVRYAKALLRQLESPGEVKDEDSAVD